MKSSIFIRFFFALIGFLLPVIDFANVVHASEVKLRYSKLIMNADLQFAEGKGFKDGVILLVHGTLAHNRMDTINNIANVLNERGLSTLAINLSLGMEDRHGMFNCESPHRHKHRDALGEIDAWLRWLKTKGAHKVVLFGHSRGGNQVALFATEKVMENVISAVLLAPTTWDSERAANGFQRYHGKHLSIVLKKAEALARAGNGEVMLKGNGLLYCKGSDVTVDSFLSYYRPDSRFHTPSLLKLTTVPMLVIAGGMDTVVRGLAGEVAPLADGKLINFAQVDDADHFFLDLFAEDIADLIETFLEQTN